MATYDQLINDRQFLGNLYNVYKELDYDIPETNQEMVDDFLSRRRSFEDNIAGTFSLSSDIDRLSDEGKARFGEVYSQVEELPRYSKKDQRLSAGHLSITPSIQFLTRQMFLVFSPDYIPWAEVQ